METHDYVLCIDHGDWPASLKTRKVYSCLVDESGEDCLYPESSRLLLLE